MKLYVASSWRNERQPEVVERLRKAGHEVYDFRRSGEMCWFGESDASITAQRLESPVAKDLFLKHWQAMVKAEACILFMPAGRSAHLEAGYFVGASKPLFILLADDDGKPELMHRMATRVCVGLGELVAMLKAWDPAKRKQAREDGAA